MTFSLINLAVRQYLHSRGYFITRKSPQLQQIQNNIMSSCVSDARDTEIGVRANFKSLKNYDDFKSALPLVRYEDISGEINRMMCGEESILYPGPIKYFSKSSGTTSQRSKFIPISDKFLRSNLIKSSWDTTTFIYQNDPEAQLFHKKSLIMGGSLHPFEANKNILVGDVSAIMIHTIPAIGRPFYAPDFDTALLSNWDEKIERVSQQCINEDIVMFGGVPTWNIVLFKYLLEKTGKNNILEIWPNLKYYLHGGVNFEPYKKLFQQYIPKSDFAYIEAYNASEGYFAVQDDFYEDGMRLLTDNGIFYEFLEIKYLDNPQRQLYTLTADQVELGKDYCIIITTCSGLWRYIIGDTIKFVNLNPLRCKVTGRTEQYINAFGEEVMISNTDMALATTIDQYNVKIKEYTVAPFIPEIDEKGYHQWAIEFEVAPFNLLEFEKALDQNLRKINSDYDAKRYQNMALQNLKIISLPKDSFQSWLRSKNKLGGQHKVPRLSNERHFINEIINVAATK